AVQKVRPDDLPAQLGEATALSGLKRDDEADAILLRVVEGGIAHGGSWYVQAVYRLMLSAELAGRAEQAQHYTDLFAQLQALGYRAGASLMLDRGNLALVQPPESHGNPVTPVARMPEFALEPDVLPELANARELIA